MPQLPDHFHPSHGDSAGQPWEGRSFDDNPFRDDDGSAPPELVAAVEAFRAGEAGPERVVDVLRTCRVLVPLIAELGESGVTETGMTVDKSADLSIVTVQGPDGRPVLPVFSSTTTMRAWNERARPIPIGMRRVAAAVVEEGTDLVILDPGSETEFGVRRPASWAIVRDGPWTPAWANDAVATAVAAGVAAEPLVRRIELAPGPGGAGLGGPELLVTLGVPAGTARDELAQLAERAQRAWSTDETVATGVDSMTLRLAPDVDESAVDEAGADGAAEAHAERAGDEPAEAPRGLRRLLRRRGGTD